MGDTTTVTGMSRVSVVTGANRGIGLELARRLVERGDHVVATARDVARASDLEAIGPAAILALDVSDEASIEAFGQALEGEVDTVDLLINNAGMGAYAVDHDGPTDVLGSVGSVGSVVAG